VAGADCYLWMAGISESEIAVNTRRIKGHEGAGRAYSLTREARFYPIVSSFFRKYRVKGSRRRLRPKIGLV
jgi:hypothetical protein